MKKYFCIFVVLLLLFILIYSANFYFLSRLSSSINNSSKFKVDAKSQVGSIFAEGFDESNVKLIYKNKNPKFDQIKNKIVRNFAPCDVGGVNYSEIWEEVNSVRKFRKKYF